MEDLNDLVLKLKRTPFCVVNAGEELLYYDVLFLQFT